VPSGGPRRRCARAGSPRRRARRSRGSSSAACSWRCGGSRPCTRRSGCSRRAAGPRRRSRDRARSCRARRRRRRRGRRVGLRHAPLLGELAQQRVGGSLALVLGDAEHLLGGLVVGRERRRPVLELAPLRVAVEGGALGRAVERVGVAEAAAADAAAGDDEDVLEERHAEDAAEAETRQPVVAARVPGRRREVLVAVAPAGLEDRDLVALLGEAERADAASEARADDDPVVVVLRHGARS
jgi:hypothetical protein